MYYRIDPKLKAGKNFHVWGGVLWLPSQNTWQVHIYISLPWGKLIISTIYWMLTMCQEFIIEDISGLILIAIYS